MWTSQRRHRMSPRRFFCFTISGLLLLFCLGSLQAAELIDINSATPDQLKALPGMTEGYVMMIVGARPFQSKEELIERKILPQDAYDQMKDRIATKGSSGGASRPQASPNPPPKSTLATDPIEKSSEGSEASASTGSSSSSRVCIKEERTKQQFCGELVK